MSLRGFTLPSEDVFNLYQEAINIKSKEYYIFSIVNFIINSKLESHKIEAINNLKKLYNVIFNQEEIKKRHNFYCKHDDAIKDTVLKKDVNVYCGIKQGCLVFYVGD